MVGQLSELHFQDAHDPLKPWAFWGPSPFLSRTLFLAFRDTKSTKLIELSSLFV